MSKAKLLGRTTVYQPNSRADQRRAKAWQRKNGCRSAKNSLKEGAEGTAAVSEGAKGR